MKNIILQSLLNKKGKLSLIAIQFFAGITALMIGLYFFEGCFQYERRLEKTVSLDTLNIYNSGEEFGGFADTCYNKIYNNFKGNDTKMSCFSTLNYSNDSLDVDSDTEQSLFVVSGDFFELINHSFAEGELDEIKGYNGQKEVPVIISSAMADKYVIGKTYSFPDTPYKGLSKYTMKIAAAMPSDFSVPLANSSDIGKTLSKPGDLDSTIILPEIPCLSKYLHYSNCLFHGERASVENYIRQNGFDMQVQSLREEVDRYNESQQTVILGALSFALVLLILSTAGCIGTLLAMVISRKEEFGIYLSLGMKKRHLTELVLGETSLIFIVIYIMAIAVFLCIIYSIESIEHFVPWISLAFSFVCTLGCMLICVIVPIRRMAGWKPVELLYKSRN